MNTYSSQLEQLSRQGNLRSLPAVDAQGLSIVRDGNTMLNFSSNDYLGLADDTNLKEEFCQNLNPRDVRFSSTSSRLLTGNFPVYARLEKDSPNCTKPKPLSYSTAATMPTAAFCRQ